MSHTCSDDECQVARHATRAGILGLVGEQRFDLGTIALAHVGGKNAERRAKEAFREPTTPTGAARHDGSPIPAYPALRHGDERSHAFHLGHEGAATLRRYAEPASVAAVLVGFRRGAELANPPMLAELIERAIEGDGPESQLATGELEDVSDDAGAVAVALGERKQDVEPVAPHVGGHGRLYTSV
jgi:hypothetical protein